MSWSNRLLFFTNVVLILFLIWAFVSRGLGAPPANSSYSDLVTIMLGAIAVILAAVTVFIAILAIWGYTALKEGAEKEARTVATDVARAIATDVAQSVATREAREAVRFAQLAEDGPETEDLDKLRTALKSGSETSPDDKP